jgi:hypothetical protein
MRNEAFNKRVEVMKRFSDKYEREGAGSKEQEQKRQEESRLAQEIIRKNRDDEEKRRSKSELTKKRIKETSDENLRIIREKEREKYQQDQENRELRGKFQQEYEDSRVEEKRKNERRRLGALEMKAALDQQIQEKQNLGSGGRNTLSLREMELNKSLLKKIEDDKGFQEEVYRRLNPDTSAAGGAGESSRSGMRGNSHGPGGAGGSRQRRSTGGNIF